MNLNHARHGERELTERVGVERQLSLRSSDWPLRDAGWRPIATASRYLTDQRRQMMSETMRAVLIREDGDNEVVRIEDVEHLEPRAGELLLRVRAAG